MSTLLEDIELSIQELKCVMRTWAETGDASLKEVACHNIRQVQRSLNVLMEQLEESLPGECQEAEVVVKNTCIVSQPVVDKQLETLVLPKTPAEEVAGSAPASILGDSIRPAADLRKAISLNDAYRFARELFQGNMEQMNEAVAQIGTSSSLDEAVKRFYQLAAPAPDNETAEDFVELLKRYFK